MKITGTFIDGISHDIPHRNWGAKEWEMDFQHMAAMGIDTVISPWIEGKKAVPAASSGLTRADAASVEEHGREWREILHGMQGAVDAVAFQDGHIDYTEPDTFFTVNKKLADQYGLQCWTNAESFDRDMQIKFFPIKFRKLQLKPEAARRAGYDEAITFEFSHFMSPQSACIQAHHLYNRYNEYKATLL